MYVWKAQELSVCGRSLHLDSFVWSELMARWSEVDALQNHPQTAEQVPVALDHPPSHLGMADAEQNKMILSPKFVSVWLMQSSTAEHISYSLCRPS